MIFYSKKICYNKFVINMRVDKNSSKLIISRLCIIISQSIKSMIQDYTFLYSDEDLSILKSMLEMISNSRDLYTINFIEKNLKDLAFRTWEYEEKQGNHFIHWLKNDILNTDNPVLSSTFGDVEPFCNSKVGIRYKTNINGFLGACEKDAGVAVEDSHRQSMYTIKVLEDGRVVNSYNLGTPIMTPKIAINTHDNNYKSKHNEIILDASIAIPVEIVCNDDYYDDLASKVSQQYGIPYYQDNKRTRI